MQNEPACFKYAGFAIMCMFVFQLAFGGQPATTPAAPKQQEIKQESEVAVRLDTNMLRDFYRSVSLAHNGFSGQFRETLSKKRNIVFSESVGGLILADLKFVAGGFNTEKAVKGSKMQQVVQAYDEAQRAYAQFSIECGNLTECLGQARDVDKMADRLQSFAENYVAYVERLAALKSGLEEYDYKGTKAVVGSLNVLLDTAMIVTVPLAIGGIAKGIGIGANAIGQMGARKFALEFAKGTVMGVGWKSALATSGIFSTVFSGFEFVKANELRKALDAFGTDQQDGLKKMRGFLYLLEEEARDLPNYTDIWKKTSKANGLIFFLEKKLEKGEELEWKKIVETFAQVFATCVLFEMGAGALRAGRALGTIKAKPVRAKEPAAGGAQREKAPAQEARKDAAAQSAQKKAAGMPREQAEAEARRLVAGMSEEYAKAGTNLGKLKEQLEVIIRHELMDGRLDAGQIGSMLQDRRVVGIFTGKEPSISGVWRCFDFLSAGYAHSPEAFESAATLVLRYDKLGARHECAFNSIAACVYSSPREVAGRMIGLFSDKEIAARLESSAYKDPGDVVTNFVYVLNGLGGEGLSPAQFFRRASQCLHEMVAKESQEEAIEAAALFAQMAKIKPPAAYAYEEAKEQLLSRIPQAERERVGAMMRDPDYEINYRLAVDCIARDPKFLGRERLGHFEEAPARPVGVTGEYYNAANDNAVGMYYPATNIVSGTIEKKAIADEISKWTHELLHYISASEGGGSASLRIAGVNKPYCKWLDEGLTELNAQRLTRANGFEPSYVAYKPDVESVYYIERLVGREILKEAYFTGEFGAVRKAVDARLGAGSFGKMIEFEEPGQVLQFLRESGAAGRITLRETGVGGKWLRELRANRELNEGVQTPQQAASEGKNVPKE